MIRRVEAPGEALSPDRPTLGKEKKMNRAARKLVLAVALLATAAFLPQRAVQSLTCCQRCQANINTCYNNCGGNTSCQANCDNTYTSCAMRCPGCPF